MADAVTYADLRFAEISLQETKLDDAAEDTDQSDVMYENVIRTPRDKEASAAPPTGTTWPQHLKARLQVWAPLLSMLLLFLCLTLLAAAIVMTIQYISVSRDLQLTSADHMELNRTVSRRLQDGEDSLLSVREKLRRSQEDLQRSREDLQRSQEELQRSQEDLQRSQEELEKETQGTRTLKLSIQEAEREMKNLQDSIKKDLCPGNWTYFGGRCLLFSADSKNWYGSRRFCEKEKSTLLVVQEEDSELKNFLGRQTDYWVGKELTNTWSPTWEWPSGYKIYESYHCGKVTDGKLDKDNCYNNNKFICQRRLVLA